MKARFRTDNANVKLKEISFKSPQDEEREVLLKCELEDPAITQREVTSPYSAPEVIVSEEQYRGLDDATNDYLRHLDNSFSHYAQDDIHPSSGSQNERISSSGESKKKKELEGLPSDQIEYKSPQNKPLIESSPVKALLLSGTSPRRSRRKLCSETQIVTGIIEDLDRKTGLVKLRVEGNFLELYFLPPAIQDLLVKDVITVRVRPL